MAEGTQQGPGRELIDAAEMEELRRSVVIDERRRRPLYFDGRFLAARDLTRDQSYFLTRQSDLGRVGGFGVTRGLMVAPGESSTSLLISAGHGVTPAGEAVGLPETLKVELSDIPTSQRLDASFGLLQLPRSPAATRTGLFVVALRPVEYSANPIASYPTSITGTRTEEAGEIIEATAITLVPYPAEGAGLTTWQRRARVAREIFLGSGSTGTSREVLPLAVVGLEHGRVDWVDPFLVRREVGADHGDVLRLGFAPRALREAHLLQYDNHLQAVLAERKSAGARFAATEYFDALPPAGRLPAAAIDPLDFTQIYFPPTVDVDVSIIPEDELVTLLEESLLLPPIDLTRSTEELDSTGVLVLIPVPRTQLRTLSSRITSTIRSARPAASWMVARRRPLEVLQGIRVPGHFVALPEPTEGEDRAWEELLESAQMLWYIRRRNLHYRPDLAGEAHPVVRTGTTEGGPEEREHLEQELKEARESAAQAEVKAREAEARARDAEERATEAEKQAKEAEARAEEAEETLGSSDSRAEEAETRISEAEARAEEAAAAARAEEQRRAQAEARARKLEEDLRAAREAADRVDEEELLDLRDRVVRTEGLLEEATREIETWKTRADELEETVTFAERDREQALADLARREEELTTELATERDAVATLTSRQQELTTQLATEQAKVTAAEATAAKVFQSIQAGDLEGAKTLMQTERFGTTTRFRDI